MRRGKSGQASLEEVLANIFSQAGLEKRLQQGRILLEWNAIVGPVNARHSQPIRVKDGILWVECSSHAWAQTLTLLRQQILDKIAQRFGPDLLREIHFSGVGKSAEADKADLPKKDLPAKIPLPVEQIEWVRELAKEISEPGLRKKAEEALGSLLRQRKWHESQGTRRCPRCERLHKGKGELCHYCQTNRGSKESEKN